jgi:hypothetical protein
MLLEEVALSVLQSPDQFGFKAHEDRVQLNGSDIKDQDLDAASASGRQLRRRNLFEVQGKGL